MIDVVEISLVGAVAVVVGKVVDKCDSGAVAAAAIPEAAGGGAGGGASARSSIATATDPVPSVAAAAPE